MPIAGGNAGADRGWSDPTLAVLKLGRLPEAAANGIEKCKRHPVRCLLCWMLFGKSRIRCAEATADLVSTFRI